MRNQDEAGADVKRAESLEGRSYDGRTQAHSKEWRQCFQFDGLVIAPAQTAVEHVLHIWECDQS